MPYIQDPKVKDLKTYKAIPEEISYVKFGKLKWTTTGKEVKPRN